MAVCGPKIFNYTSSIAAILFVYTKQLADVYNNNNNNQTPTTPQLSRDVQNNGVWGLINGCCLL